MGQGKARQGKARQGKVGTGPAGNCGLCTLVLEDWPVLAMLARNMWQLTLVTRDPQVVA